MEAKFHKCLNRIGNLSFISKSTFMFKIIMKVEFKAQMILNINSFGAKLL